MASVFRFPTATIAVDADQKIAVRHTDGKFYQVTVQDILDLVASGDYPSISDDGSTVTIDADVHIVSGGDLSVTSGGTVSIPSGGRLAVASGGTIAAAGTVLMTNLPASDTHVSGQLYVVSGGVLVSAG